MSVKIVGVTRPFDLKQKVMVYEDNNLIDQAESTIENLNDTIFSLSEKYNTKRVDLTGPKQYNCGLARKMQEAELNKYNKNTLEVNVL